MKNPFTKEIKLKQHSPLIHFQHDQWGATIRATELKPKLDRFLISKLGDFPAFKDYLLDFDQKEFNKLNSEQKKEYEKNIHKALDYKVRIKSPEIKKEDIKEIKHSLFFGNIGKKGKGEKEIKSVCLNKDQDVSLTIFSFKKNLLKIIIEYLAEFFAISNIGTRQNKGFGSFYISEKDQLFKDITEVLPEETYYIELNSLEDKEIFSTISYYYKRLKSGINPSYGSDCKEGYHKAYLFKYLDNKNLGYTWEKRWIKEKFFGLKPDQKNKKFARALLGLPGSFAFKATDEPCNTKSQRISIEDDYEIEISNDEIARIKSPLTFKIYKDSETKKSKIYILIDKELLAEINEKICKKHITFDFKLKFKLKYEQYFRNGKKKYKQKLIPHNESKHKKYNFYIKKAQELEEKENKFLGQLERFNTFKGRDFIEVTLSTPEINLDMNNLIKCYHKELNFQINDTFENISLKADIKKITKNE